MTPSEKTAAAVALLEQMNRFKASCRTAQDFSVYRAWLFDQRETLIAFLSLFESGEYVVVPRIKQEVCQNVHDELDGQMAHSLNAYSLPLWPEEAAALKSVCSAMLGAA